MKAFVAVILCVICVVYAAGGAQPVVAIHDSEFTRTLQSTTATAPTPSGAGTTGFEWWPTNWNYFVMPESVKEALASDGTEYAVVGDSNIIAGVLLTNGAPVYPIVISLASEAIRNDEIAPLTNYVAAGGFLVVGSSAFTRNTNGTARGNFAFANELGVNMVTASLTNWGGNSTFTKVVEHRIINHLPSGLLNWRLPTAAEEIPGGLSPTHPAVASHLIWRVAASTATVLAQGDASPYLLVKPYGKGFFIYYAPMQPLVAHGGYQPGMYAYMTIRKMIEWAFENSKVPVAKISPWPFPYDSAFMVRHDMENFQAEIANIEASAQFESTNGAKGDYYFCSGTIRADMPVSGIFNPTNVIAGLQRAVSNYNATVSTHNGWFRNTNNPALTQLEYDFWHWGPDEALDVVFTTNFANGKAYALASVSNSFAEVEGWLGGLATNTMRTWAAPYFNAVREDSFDIQDQIGVKATGEQKISAFPHWTLSTKTANKRYAFVSIPVSDWYIPGTSPMPIAQSMEAHSGTASVRDLVDFYYNNGLLINLYSHTLSTGMGPAGGLASDYVTYTANTNLHPRLWPANAIEVYKWWLQRSNAQISVVNYTTNINRSVTILTASGATDTNTAVELLLPNVGEISGVQVFTNGTVAGGNSFRTKGLTLKVRIGTAITNAEVRYVLGPKGQNDFYVVDSSTNTLVTLASGILANDVAGLGGTNLTATLLTNVLSGTLFLTNNGGFSYRPNTNFSGTDSFVYQANDGVTNSAPVTVTLSVNPPGVMFSDSFTRPPGASSLNPWRLALGTWEITNGLLQGTSPLQNYGNAYISNNWTDYAVEGKIRFPNTSVFGGGIGGRVNATNGAHYGAWVFPENSTGGSNVLKLIKYTSWSTWSGTPMQQANLPAVGTNTHTLRVTFSGNRIFASYDGTQVIDVTDNNYEGIDPFPSGGISADMWTYLTGYTFSVDDVLVTPPPVVPVANSDTYNVTLGTTLTVPVPGVLTNDTPGAGGGALSAILGTSPTHGIFNFNTNGAFNYTPTNFIGVDSFTYQAFDGITNSAAATATLNVLTNHPPAATSDTYSFAANTTLTVAAPGVLANDTDVDGNSIIAVLDAGPLHGNLSLSTNGGFVYTPTNSYSGSDSFSYHAQDWQTNSSPVTVMLTILPQGALFFDDFTRSTDPAGTFPWVVRQGSWSITGGTMQGFTNITQIYGNIYLTNVWSSYSVEGRLRFPAGAYGGGIGGCLDPVTGSQYAAWVFPEGSPGGSNVLKLLKFSSWTSWGYQGAPFTPIFQTNLGSVGTNFHTVKIAFHTNHIAVYFDTNMLINVTDAEATPLLSGGVSLNMWTESPPYILTADDILVRPLAADDSYNVAINTTLSLPAPGVLGNDTETYGTNLTAALITGPVHGILFLTNNGGFNYTPTNSYLGADSFVYRADDGALTLGNATVSITVTNASNVAPVLPTQTNRNVFEFANLFVTNTASDADAVTYTLAVTNLLDNSVVTNASISAAGVISFTPTELQGNSTNRFTTIVTDSGTPPLSATNTFLVTVLESNAFPVLPAQTNRLIAEFATLSVTNTGTDSDIPVNVLSYTLTVTNTGNNTVVTNASITAAGVITWTPTELQGNTTNRFTTIVTDDGSPNRKATNAFLVTVSEVNAAPVLPAQTNRIAVELVTLFATNTATDSDIPTNILSYTLSVTNLLDNSAVTNASISASGVISWNPTELQGNSTNRFTTVVTDNGSPPLSATNTFLVTVNEANATPVLPTQTNLSAVELIALFVTNTATDSDIPVNVLSYTLAVTNLLDNSAVTNASISASGVISWIPTELQGNSTNRFTTVVTDNGSPPLSATNTFLITVNEANATPVLPTQTNLVAVELIALFVTNTATDSDIPVNVLSYTLAVTNLLDNSAVTNASISASGVISWVPTELQGNSTNRFTTVVTDNGSPNRKATNTFLVTVDEANAVPVLPTQTNLNAVELIALFVTNTATDSDIPVNALSYTLAVTNLLDNSVVTNASISASGVISWVPTELQGNSTNRFTTVVTDNGTPPLSATNTFLVTVNEVNSAPALPAQANRNVAELVTLLATNTATDSDVPVNVLTYTLTVTNLADNSLVTNAGISASGVITWTPTGLQGGTTNLFTTVVTDDGAPPLSATNTFLAVVTENNTPPSLPVQTNQIAIELVTLTVTNTATDPDIPPNVLTYMLAVTNLADNSLVTNAGISASGVITWTPTELQGSTTNLFTTVVTDDGVPVQSATNSFLVVVNEANAVPVLPAQTNLVVLELSPLFVTNTATDSDVPTNALSYTLTVTNIFDDSPVTNAAVNASGVISWIPTELQGSTTNLFTTVVTDNGTPALSATNTFLVVVNEVNAAPVLPAQTNRTAVEFVTLFVTNTASDSDIPANVLSYILTVTNTFNTAVTNASISSSGVISWTPTESQGSTTNIFTTIVTDNGAPPLSTTNTFVVAVSEANAAPALPPQSDRTALEFVTLLVTNTATDSDIPANILSYTLTVTNTSDSSVVTNASISAAGVISWAPTELQGSTTNRFTTIVTDNGTPPLSATNTFVVVVGEVNSAPILPAQTDHTIDVLTTLLVTNTATDSDVPVNTLSYLLLAGPTNASISVTGVITWTPTAAQAPATNTFITVVTDSNPLAVNAQQLSATNSFAVIVNTVAVPQPVILSISASNSIATLKWTTVTGHIYRLQSTENLTATNWDNASVDETAAGSVMSGTNGTGSSHRFYRVFLVH